MWGGGGGVVWGLGQEGGGFKMHRDTKSNKYAKERDYSMSLTLSL